MAQVELFDITLQLYGIKKYCRKVDLHRIDVARIPYDNGHYDIEEVIKLAKSKIFSELRSVSSDFGTINMNHIKTSTDRGFHCSQWEPFSDKNKSFKINLTSHKEMSK